MFIIFQLRLPNKAPTSKSIWLRLWLQSLQNATPLDSDFDPAPLRIESCMKECWWQGRRSSYAKGCSNTTLYGCNFTQLGKKNLLKFFKIRIGEVKKIFR